MEFKALRVSAINTDERFIADARRRAGDISYLLMERNVIRFAETLYAFSRSTEISIKKSARVDYFIDIHLRVFLQQLFFLENPFRNERFLRFDA